MIKLNLKNAITESGIEKYKKNVEIISKRIENLESEGFEWLGWKDWPENIHPREVGNMQQTAKRLVKQGIDLLVVIGIGGSFAGSKAGIEMVQGEYPEKQKMEIMYVGESLSSTNLQQKLVYAEGKNFAINVISKSGTTTEPALAFRLFRKLMEDKIGLHNSTQFIFATTDPTKGALLEIAKDRKYKTFSIPSNIGGRFSVLTSVGLFPMACAGLNIERILDGAKNANEAYKTPDIEINAAYRYAAARMILNKTLNVELMVQYEPQMKAFNEWWKQLAGESEGKNGRGLFPASAVFSTDLHSLGQFIQEGTKVLFETVITVKTPSANITIFSDKKNIDNLNYLSGKDIQEVNKVAFEATTEAHVKIGKVPNIHLEIDKMDEYNFGELVIFFERAVTMTAYLLKVNPFNQPGVEVYKQNMFKALGKPE